MKKLILIFLLMCSPIAGYAHDSGSGEMPYSVFDQSTAPTITDDVSEGFTPGSLWLDTTAKIQYQCTDNTAGAAVWEAIGEAAFDEDDIVLFEYDFDIPIDILVEFEGNIVICDCP